jgi:transketolase
VTTTANDEQAITAARCLILDAVESAGGGHVGGAIALVPAAYKLWTQFLRFDPNDPTWDGRDRVVLSNGHACILQYVVLHLTGYDVTVGDLAALRDAGSRTPGHPEYGRTPGVEVTTGPLGQGVANAVGMALADRLHNLRRDDAQISDKRVWVFAGDGCLMEGIASEASSLAGTWKLSNLTLIYDDNGITIDAPTSDTFSEDTDQRYRSYGWKVVRVDDGNDLDALSAAYTAAIENTEAPTFIHLKTRVAYGVPDLEGTTAAHGGALAPGVVARAKKAYGWPYTGTFVVPEDASSAWRARSGREQSTDSHSQSRTSSSSQPSEDEPWETALDSVDLPTGRVATRKVSSLVLGKLARALPNLIGGAADLAESSGAYMKGAGDFTGSTFGRNILFGVREHAMAGIANGLALDGRSRVFVGTFLAFSDYMRPSLRLAALMGLPVVFVFSHDSVALGADGPTHQPVEQLSSLRLMPNLFVVRPADPAETVEAWRLALRRRSGPTALVLSRQEIEIRTRPIVEAAGLHRGAYIILPEDRDHIDLILIATGSEVAIAIDAQRVLEEEDGLSVRVVSMPCWEAFEAESQHYRDMVLPPDVSARLAVEAGATAPWWKWVGLHGTVIGVDTFGACARGVETWQRYGFNTGNVVAQARRLLDKHSPAN